MSLLTPHFEYVYDCLRPPKQSWEGQIAERNPLVRVSYGRYSAGVMVANPEDIDIDEGGEDEEMAEPGDAVEERAVPVSLLFINALISLRLVA